jgi:hypothetical protein
MVAAVVVDVDVEDDRALWKHSRSMLSRIDGQS